MKLGIHIEDLDFWNVIIYRKTQNSLTSECSSLDVQHVEGLPARHVVASLSALVEQVDNERSSSHVAIFVVENLLIARRYSHDDFENSLPPKRLQPYFNMTRQSEPPLPNVNTVR